MGTKKKEQAKGGKTKAKRGNGKEEEPAAAAAAERHTNGGKQRRKGRKEVGCWAADDLERELAAVGLRIKRIEADGNCFFRSICDQLEGDGGDHTALRWRVLDFIQAGEEHYRLFLEDDEPWEPYLKRMRKDGAWADNMELVATSQLLRRHLHVYQSGQPVWTIQYEGGTPEGPPLHICYHDGMHYNSVRNADDHSSGPPEPLRPCSSGAAANGGSAAAAQPLFGGAEVDRVVEGTGCCDRQRVAAVLQQCGGSVEQAIEQLIEQLGQEGEEDCGSGGGGGGATPPQEDPQQQAAAQQGGADAGTAQQARQERQEAAQQEAAAPQQQAQQLGEDSIRLELRPRPGDPGRVAVALHPAAGTQQAQDAAAGTGGEPAGGRREAAGGKRDTRVRVGFKHKVAHPSRNSRCPCGSKLKYKSCCGVRRAGQSRSGAAATDEGGDAATASNHLKALFI